MGVSLNRFFLNGSFFLLSLFIFFSVHMYSDTFLMIIVFSTLLAFLFFNKTAIKINKYNITFFIIGLLLIISVMYTPNFADAFKYMIVLLLFISIKIMLDNVSGWQKKMSTLFCWGAFIFVLATLLQFITPSFINKINLLFLDSRQLYHNTVLYQGGYYAGITGQTSYNAFYISIYVGIVYTGLTNNNKLKKWILLALGIISLLLTGKRGLLVANIFAISLVSFFNTKGKLNRIFKTISVIVGVLLVLYVITEFIPSASIGLNKFQNTADLTSGRDVIYAELWTHIKGSFIFGNGLYSSSYLIGNTPHNMYLQLLNEVGIVGAIIFIIAFTMSIKATMRVLSLTSIENQYYKKNIASFSLYIQIIFLVYGLTGNTLIEYTQFLAYLVATSMVNSIIIKHKKTQYNNRDIGKLATVYTE